jgi:hypothetical protein
VLQKPATQAEKYFSLPFDINIYIICACCQKLAFKTPSGCGHRTVAALCGVAQSRVSNVVSGQLENFSLYALVEIGDRLGC